MKDNREPWDEIAALIALEKKAALRDFHRLEFIPSALPELRAAAVSRSRLVLSPAITALAASVLVAAGLASFWLLKGSWGSISSAPTLSALLSDSYLFSGAASAEAAASATVPAPAANPYLAAWVKAGLGRASAAAEEVDPLTPVERGDPVAVRRKLNRVIRENALERLLTQFHEIHNKEA
jgi:hypothetical protein